MGGYLEFSNDPGKLQNYSAFRERSYGYSRLTFINFSSIFIEYIEVVSGAVHDNVTITKII